MSSQTTRPNEIEVEHWRVDKHIPVALILTLILTVLANAAAMVWWGSGIQYTQQDHERRLVAQEESKIAERMAVVENQIRSSKELQIDMNSKLDRILERQRPAK